jgi:hypothetical protein
VRGGDAAGSNPETYNGVTYTTDIVPTTTRFLWDGDNLTLELTRFSGHRV